MARDGFVITAAAVPEATCDAVLAELDSLDTQQVYDVLQGWCAAGGERLLVDKTPPYIWSLDTLRRAEVGRCKLDPSLKATWFQPLNLRVHPVLST